MKLSIIKRNVVANLIGTGMVTVLTILITPLQINLLGMESFGVVGFIATLQAMFAAFDLGLSSTLTRELAADVSLDKRSNQALLSTAATIYWCSAILIGLLIATFAAPISRWWFHAEMLSPQMLATSLRVIALYLALRWPAALYVGILSGLQRMEVLNLVKVLVTLVRLAGGILVLLHWRNLNTFLIWTAVSAVFEVGSYWMACRRVMPSLSMRIGFSAATLRRVWKYSASMNALAVLAIAITQLDRLTISKMEPLAVLGYYNLAYTTASGIPLIISAIGSAVFPWFTEAQEDHDLSALRSRYFSATWVMLFFVGLPSLILAFYGPFLLTYWVNPMAAGRVGVATTLLATGFWLSAVVSNAYYVALARGMPGRPLQVAAISAVPYALVIVTLVHFLGGNGAAVAWLLLNASNAVFLLPYIHSKILKLDTWDWLSRTLLPLLALGLISFLPIKLFAVLTGLNAYITENVIALLSSIAIYISVGYYLSPLAGLSKPARVLMEPKS